MTLGAARDRPQPLAIAAGVFLGVGVGTLLPDTWHLAFRLAVVGAVTGAAVAILAAIWRARAARPQPVP